MIHKPCTAYVITYAVSVFWIRIRKFLGVPDPLTEVRIRILPYSSKNSKKTLVFLLFCDFFMTFYLRRMMYMCFQEVPNQKKTEKKIYFFVGILKVTDDKIRIRTKMSRVRNTGCKWLFFSLFPFDIYQCCGSGINIFPSRIPDPNYFHPGLCSTSKNLSILTQKIVFKVSEIWSGLFIPDLDPGYTDPDFLPIPDTVPDPGAKKGHRIPDPQRWYLCCISCGYTGEGEQHAGRVPGEGDGPDPRPGADRTSGGDQILTGQLFTVMVIDLEGHLS